MGIMVDVASRLRASHRPCLERRLRRPARGYARGPAQSGRCVAGEFDAGRPPATRGDPGGFDLAAASSLYPSLTAPIEGDLRGATTLYIATSGILASVPFDALLTRRAASLAQANWWIDTSTPVRIPSASALMLARSLPATHASEPFIAFADPSFDGRDTPASLTPGAPAPWFRRARCRSMEPRLR
jgi:CHAT domain